MQPAFKLGLRGRLILLLLAAFTALAGVIVAQSLHDRSDMIAAASGQLMGQAKLIAARQQFITARGDALLSSLLLHPELGAAAPADACSPLLPDMLKKQTEFINIGWALPGGALACSAVPAAGPLNFADRVWFQQALQTREMVVGDVVTGRVVGKPVLSLAKAMRDGAGHVTGVFFVSLEIAWLERQLAKEHLPQGARLVVVDDQGLVAVRQPDPEGWAGRSIAHQPLFKHIQADSGEGVAEETGGLDGVRRLYAHAPLLATASGRKYHLLLGVPRTAVVVAAQRDLVVSLALALLIFAVALALVVGGVNRLVLRPLLALSRTAARLGAGDLAARSGLPHTDDEVGRLARELDEGGDHLQTSERKLKRVNRALRVLSAGNQILLRAKGEQELIEVMCRAIVEAGGYRLAWVGYAETDGAKSVRPVAASGEATDDFLGGLQVRWDDTAAGYGPTGTAIRQGIAVAANNVQTNPDYGPWRERAQRYGYASSLALPLRIDGAVIGALNLYAAEPDAFDAEEVKLLSETASDLAFGIATQRTAAEHARTQAALKTAKDVFQAAANASLDALFILRPDGAVRWINDRGYAMRDDSGQVSLTTGVASDITERKKHEAQIINLNRALRTLSACNLALVHAQTEEELLQNVCRHIVETGGYRVAFIGFAGDDAAKTVSIVAQHGAEAGYLESLGFTWADTDQGQGTVGRAIRSGAPQVSQNIMTDPKLTAWRVAANKLESRASISLPFKWKDGKVFGMLTISAAEADAFDAGEVELFTELADDIVFGIVTLRTRAERDRIAYAHVHHAEILQKSLEQSIQAIADTVEARDPYTAGHQRRVSELAVAIARELGLPEDKIHGIHLAATIHDLGKVHIPAEYLSKPGKLTDIEFVIIKTHPQAGYDILKGIEFPWPIADIVRQHHERLDGSGYPQGLKDGQILLESRIMAVADVVEAMASHRPYRPTLGIEAALQEIERGRGSAYDPAVADACLKLFREGRFAFQV